MKIIIESKSMNLEKPGNEFEEMFSELNEVSQDLVRKAERALEQVRTWPEDKQGRFWNESLRRCQGEKATVAAVIDAALLEVADLPMKEIAHRSMKKRAELDE